MLTVALMKFEDKLITHMCWKTWTYYQNQNSCRKVQKYIEKILILRTLSDNLIFFFYFSGTEECEVKLEGILAVSKIASACAEVVNTGRAISLNLNDSKSMNI